MTRTVCLSFCNPDDDTVDERDAVRVRVAAGDCVASYSYPAVAVEGRGGDENALPDASILVSGRIAENVEKL